MAATSTEPVTIALVEDDDEARRQLVASIRSDPSLRLVGENAQAAYGDIARYLFAWRSPMGDLK